MAIATKGTAKRALGSSEIGAFSIFSMLMVLFLLLLAIWEAISLFELLPTYIIGNPTGVAKQLYVWLTSKAIYTHLGVTLLETVLAFTIGTLLGISVGMALGLDRTLARLFDPYLKAFNAHPRV